jgi:carboxyl-terminal processing protease
LNSEATEKLLIRFHGSEKTEFLHPQATAGCIVEFAVVSLLLREGGVKAMKSIKFPVLLLSGFIVVLLVGGGMFFRADADDNSYRQVVVFSEVLSLVLDNYVDPVEADNLLEGAYEGMLRGLDPHAAYLTPGEVTEWKESGGDLSAGPGLTVLKGYGALQVVAVDPASPAEEAGFKAGDQIRAIDDRPLRNYSLDQAMRMLRGPAGTTVNLEMIRPSEGFDREELSLVRKVRGKTPYRLDVRGEVLVLKIHDLTRTPVSDLLTDLGDYQSQGIARLLIDLRNVAEGTPRDARTFTALFHSGVAYQLTDRSGDSLETVELQESPRAWKGQVVLLVNGATAGAAEGFSRLLQVNGTARVFGESTYGLGTEPALFELKNGSGVLVSVNVWQLAGGESWNEKGIEPDVEIQPEGLSYEDRLKDQMEKALEACTAPEKESENV